MAVISKPTKRGVAMRFRRCVDCGSEYLTQRYGKAQAAKLGRAYKRLRCYGCEARKWRSINVIVSR